MYNIYSTNNKNVIFQNQTIVKFPGLVENTECAVECDIGHGCAYHVRL